MLNRVFIVIGGLAIVALLAAFLVPRFIPWGNYRDRMEIAAGQALGAQVEIKGEIAFQLLPQPVLSFNDVAVGPEGGPSLTVAHVEAELSLIDFLRDHYRITRLSLEEPRLAVGVTTDGEMIAPRLGSGGGRVEIESAILSAGTLIIDDSRSQNDLRVDGIAGELEFPQASAPLSFQGSGLMGGGAYDIRFTSTPSTASAGRSSVSLFVARADQSTSFSAEGDLNLAASPTFNGELLLRRRPPAGTGDEARGNFLITSTVEASLQRIRLPAYIILPDENRVGTRLTGQAELTLGETSSFEAAISGGVLSLPPRDATAEEAITPYELVRMLAELPAPPIVGVPGTIGVDVAELNLRGIALRNVQFNAESAATGWSVKNFTAQLPGNSTLKLAGTVTADNERPRFAGSMSLATSRLDALAQLWRKPASPNPLFGVGAAYEADVELGADTLRLANGTLQLGDGSHPLALDIGFGATRRLDVAGRLGALSAGESEVLAALLPDTGPGGSFGVTFPRGSVSLAAEAATIAGLNGRGLALEGSWGGGILEVTSLKAEDFGGARINLLGSLFGTAARPELYGEAQVAIAAPGAAALSRLLDLLAVPPALRQAIERSVPAELSLQLEPPGGDGGQRVALTGTAGAAQVGAEAHFASGLVRHAGAPLGLTLRMSSAEVAALSDQLGLQAAGGVLSPDGPMSVEVVLQGTPGRVVETSVTLASGSDSIGFSGTLGLSDPERWTGRGTLQANLSDPSALASELGAQGLWIPPVRGSAALEFTGLDTIRLTEISAESDGQPFTGRLALYRQDDAGAVSGEFALGPIPLEGLAATLVGPAALISSNTGPWPDGPLDVTAAGRSTTGRIVITTPAVTSGDARLLEEVRFGLAWDDDSVRLAEFEGGLGGGRLTLDARLCCTGALPERTLSARVGVEGTNIAALLPAAAVANLSGVVTGAANVEGTGDSIQAVVAALAGQGSFAVRDLRIDGLSGTAFAAAAQMENISEAAPDLLAGEIEQALSAGTFQAAELAGSFTIVGGRLRSPNMTVVGDGVRLLGDANVGLADLSLSGSYAISPLTPVGEGGYLNETTAQVVANLSGSLLEPQASFDVGSLVDAIQVHAFETELAELERLRAEDEARMAAARQVRQGADAAASVSAAVGVLSATHEQVLSGRQRAAETAVIAAEAMAASVAVAEQAARRAAEEARRRAEEEQALQAQEADELRAPLPGALILTPTEPETRF